MISWPGVIRRSTRHGLERVIEDWPARPAWGVRWDQAGSFRVFLLVYGGQNGLFHRVSIQGRFKGGPNDPTQQAARGHP